jgi:hypothetical protein
MRIPIQTNGSVQRVNTVAHDAHIMPSLYDFYNVFPELLKVMPVIPPEFTIPNPALCDLACGEVRIDCFREGGTLEKCNQEYSNCTWDCFRSA